MILKYTLNNEIEGEHVTTYSPKGWQETELVLSRHEIYEGIFKDYTVKVEFFCGAGKEYIDNIYDTQGIEAVVTCLIEMDCNESGIFETLYDGKLIMKSFEKVEAAPAYSRANLEQIGIIQTVLNRMEIKIDLTKTETLDGDSVDPLTYLGYDLTTHSKQILMRSEFLTLENHILGSEDTIYVSEGFNPGDSVSADFPMYSTIGDIQFTNYVTPNFLLTNSFRSQALIETQEELLEVTEEFRLKGSFKLRGQLLGIGKYEIISFGLIRQGPDGTTVLYSASSGGQFTGDFEIPFDVTDTIVHSDVQTGTRFSYYFGMVTADQTIDPLTQIPFDVVLSIDDEITYSNFQAKSETEPSITKSFAIFETGADIARKITNKADSFRSNYLGRTNSEPYAYTVNGCGSFTAITNGFQLRGFPLVDRPVYCSMMEYFESLNAIHCLGLGVKQDGDNTYIEIEPKEYFYRNDEVVLTLNNIRGLTTTFNQKAFYNSVKIGFDQWRKEGVNGLDEFCTKHEYATQLKSIKNELTAVSTFIAGPYALERERRQRYSSSTTTDADYDNNNFIIALNRSVDESNIPTGLDIAEKDENYTDVDNVLSPETIYNLRFKPSRSIRNWYKILSTSLIKLNDTLKTVRFVFGEGNKSITSTGAEICDPANQDVVTAGEDLIIEVPNSSTDYEPLFSGEIDVLEEYPLSFSNYLHLKSLDDNGIPNYYKLVRYSTGESNYIYGFIDEIRYRPVQGKASFKFRRAYTTEIGCTHIYVEAGYVECGYVE